MLIELVGMYPFRTEFPVTSTLRQFRRYVDWWGLKASERNFRSAAFAAPAVGER